MNLNADNVAIGGGFAFAAGGDSVYAVNVTTGARVWTFLRDEQGARCEIAADDQTVYVGTAT